MRSSRRKLSRMGLDLRNSRKFPATQYIPMKAINYFTHWHADQKCSLKQELCKHYSSLHWPLLITSSTKCTDRVVHSHTFGFGTPLIKFVWETFVKAMQSGVHTVLCTITGQCLTPTTWPCTRSMAVDNNVKSVQATSTNLHDLMVFKDTRLTTYEYWLLSSPLCMHMG